MVAHLSRELRSKLAQQSESLISIWEAANGTPLQLLLQLCKPHRHHQPFVPAVLLLVPSGEMLLVHQPLQRRLSLREIQMQLLPQLIRLFSRWLYGAPGLHLPGVDFGRELVLDRGTLEYQTRRDAVVGLEQWLAAVTLGNVLRVVRSL